MTTIEQEKKINHEQASWLNGAQEWAHFYALQAIIRNANFAVPIHGCSQPVSMKRDDNKLCCF